MCGLIRKNCLGHPVFPVIPALATWGPLALENAAPSSGFAPREGCRAGKPLPSRPGAVPFHQHLRAGEGGQAQASAPRKSRVSGGMAVACLKASLFLGIVQNVSCGFSSSLLFFLLTLPIRPSESPDSTGKQQTLTLLRASQRQRSPVEWGEGRKVRGRGMAEDNPSPFQTVREDVAAESERSQGPTQNNADSQGQGKKGALH